MKKNLFVGLIALAVTSQVVHAGGPDHPGKGPEARIEALTERLSLTEDQQIKVKEILEARRSETQALTEKMKAVHEKANADIEAILTPEQKKKFAEMKEKGRERREIQREKMKEFRKEQKGEAK